MADPTMERGPNIRLTGLGIENQELGALIREGLGAVAARDALPEVVQRQDPFNRDTEHQATIDRIENACVALARYVVDGHEAGEVSDAEAVTAAGLYGGAGVARSLFEYELDRKSAKQAAERFRRMEDGALFARWDAGPWVDEDFLTGYLKRHNVYDTNDVRIQIAGQLAARPTITVGLKHATSSIRVDIRASLADGRTDEFEWSQCLVAGNNQVTEFAKRWAAGLNLKHASMTDDRLGQAMQSVGEFDKLGHFDEVAKARETLLNEARLYVSNGAVAHIESILAGLYKLDDPLFDRAVGRLLQVHMRRGDDMSDLHGIADTLLKLKYDSVVPESWSERLSRVGEAYAWLGQIAAGQEA